MAIVRLTGGLGNTLFQYSFGRSLSIKRGIPVSYHWARSTWDYQLEHFNVNVDFAQPKGKLGPVYDELSPAYDPAVYDQPEDCYYRGYFQSEKYFDVETVRREITLKSKLS